MVFCCTNKFGLWENQICVYICSPDFKKSDA
jgi:hypothetical protein